MSLALMRQQLQELLSSELWESAELLGGFLLSASADGGGAVPPGERAQDLALFADALLGKREHRRALEYYRRAIQLSRLVPISPVAATPSASGAGGVAITAANGGGTRTGQGDGGEGKGASAGGGGRGGRARMGAGVGTVNTPELAGVEPATPGAPLTPAQPQRPGEGPDSSLITPNPIVGYGGGGLGARFAATPAPAVGTPASRARTAAAAAAAAGGSGASGAAATGAAATSGGSYPKP